MTHQSLQSCIDNQGQNSDDSQGDFVPTVGAVFKVWQMNKKNGHLQATY